jgi:hypothetical protein
MFGEHLGQGLGAEWVGVPQGQATMPGLGRWRVLWAVGVATGSRQWFTGEDVLAPFDVGNDASELSDHARWEWQCRSAELRCR